MCYGTNYCNLEISSLPRNYLSSRESRGWFIARAYHSSSQWQCSHAPSIGRAPLLPRELKKIFIEPRRYSVVVEQRFAASPTPTRGFHKTNRQKADNAGASTTASTVPAPTAGKLTPRPRPRFHICEMLSFRRACQVRGQDSVGRQTPASGRASSLVYARFRQGSGRARDQHLHEKAD